MYVLGFWFVLQFINSFLSTSSGGGGVAYAAHIGGFISGLILILFFNKKNTRNNLKKQLKILRKKDPGNNELYNTFYNFNNRSCIYS